MSSQLCPQRLLFCCQTAAISVSWDEVGQTSKISRYFLFHDLCSGGRHSEINLRHSYWEILFLYFFKKNSLEHCLFIDRRASLTQSIVFSGVIQQQIDCINQRWNTRSPLCSDSLFFFSLASLPEVEFLQWDYLCFVSTVLLQYSEMSHIKS